MKGDAKLGLFVFLVLVISVVFLVAHEWRQRKARAQDGNPETTASVPAPGAPDPSLPPTMRGADQATGVLSQHPPMEPMPAPKKTAASAEPAKGQVPTSLTSALNTPAPGTGSAGSAGMAETPASADGSFSTYTVQSGDSLWKISQKVYGDGSKWNKIMEANRDKIPSRNASLKVGTQLKVPSAEARPSSPAPSRKSSGPASAEPETELASAGGRTYEVRSGDSLYKIAMKYYGNGSKEKTDLIVSANKDKLRGSDHMLRVGTKLMIPDTH